MHHFVFASTVGFPSQISLICRILLTHNLSASSTEVQIHFTAYACTHLVHSNSGYKYFRRVVRWLIRKTFFKLVSFWWVGLLLRFAVMLYLCLCVCAFAVGPVRKVHALNITWALPPQEKHYRWVSHSRCSYEGGEERMNRVMTDHTCICSCFFFLPLRVNVKSTQPKDATLSSDLRWITSVGCFFFFIAGWSLSTTSHGWLAMKAPEASSQCWGRSECYCICLFVFLIQAHSKFQLKALHFTGYIGAFCSSERALSVWTLSSNYSLCHPSWQSDSYLLLSGCGFTRASLFLQSSKVIRKRLCRLTIQRAHQIVPLLSTPLGCHGDIISLFFVCAVFTRWLMMTVKFERTLSQFAAKTSHSDKRVAVCIEFISHRGARRCFEIG